MRGGHIPGATLTRLKLILNSVKVMAQRASDRRRLKGWHRERHRRRHGR